jgi:hypothetical protein
MSVANDGDRVGNCDETVMDTHAARVSNPTVRFLLPESDLPQSVLFCILKTRFWQNRSLVTIGSNVKKIHIVPGTSDVLVL